MALKFYQSYDMSEKDFDELFCRECTRNGSSVDSLNFCVGCESLFCLQCLQDHKQDEVVAQWNHYHEDSTEYNNNNQSLSYKFEANNNNSYSRNTKKNQSQAKYQVKQSLLLLQKQLQNHLEQDHAENVNRLQKVKEHAEYKMNELRTKVTKWLDEFQTRMSDSILDLHHETEKVVAHNKLPVHILMAKTEAALDTIQTPETDINDLASFTEKTKSDAKRLFEDPDNHYRKICKSLEKVEHDNINKILSESMEELVVNINILAYTLTTETGSNETVVRSYEVRGQRDTTVCDINGSCILPDGSVLLTDWNNTNIKLLDPTYKVIDTCDVPGIPWDVCCTGIKEVAVSLHFLQKIQFVSVTDNSLQLTKSFKVRQNCRGVSYTDDKIYVGCGGGGIIEESGQIQVYTREGTLLQVFKLDILGNSILSCPQHLAISEDKSELYVADKDFGMVVVNVLDKVPAETNIKASHSMISEERKVDKAQSNSSFKAPHSKTSREAKGICLTDDSTVLVCDYVMNNIAVYRMVEGKITEVQNVLDKKLNIKNPQSLCYKKLNNHLIVTCGNTNCIEVFETAIKR